MCERKLLPGLPDTEVTRAEFEAAVIDFIDTNVEFATPELREDFMETLIWYYAPWPHIDDVNANNQQLIMVNNKSLLRACCLLQNNFIVYPFLISIVTQRAVNTYNSRCVYACVQMTTDATFGFDNDYSAKMHMRGPATTYQYLFSYMSDNHTFPDWMGTFVIIHCFTYYNTVFSSFWLQRE